MVIINKSNTSKAVQGVQIAKGLVKTVGGIASQNYAAAVTGAIEMLPPKFLAKLLSALGFMILIPLIVLATVPQMLFNWGSLDDEELAVRNQHAAELVQCYKETIAGLEEGAAPDMYWLIVIESVRSRQNVESISIQDVKNSVANSYTKDRDTGKIHNKSPDEMMSSLGFSEEEKNWAYLMYSTLNGQVLDPSGEFGDAGGLPSYDGVTLGEAGETQVVYYNQLDSRWSNQLYGRSSTIGAAGCGPTSLAIAVSTLTGNTVDPPTVCAWSVANGHRCEGSGSYHSLIPEGAKHYGLQVEYLGRSSARELEKHLSSGHLVIAIMAKGHFTSSGHFIVLRGITKDGKVLVADPASYKRSGQEWDMSIILNEARGDAASGGPFWSLSK